MPKKTHILLIVGIFSLLYSCSYTRYVPEGKLILWENDIEVEGGMSVPYGVSDILKQRETNKFLKVFAPEAAIYNWGDGTDSSFFSKFGTAPVVFDSSKAQAGAQQIQDYFFNKGYFDAQSSLKITPHPKKRRVKVDYTIKPGDQYYIRNYEEKFSNPKMYALSKQQYAKEKRISKGDVYDADRLDDERERLAQIFRDNGFYNFSKQFITFKADTFLLGDSVDVSLYVSKQEVKTKDTTYTRDFQQYNVGKVYILPNHLPGKKYDLSDSLHFQDFDILYKKLAYKPRYLTDAIHISPGKMYAQKKVKDTYSHLISYDAFQFTEVSFQPVLDDSGKAVVDAYIKLSPLPKRTFSYDIEATSTSGNLGMSGAVGWLNRNIFKSGEELQFKVNAGIEYQPSFTADANVSRTFEFGGEIGINFPRFLLPFNTIGLIPKRMRPTSRFSIYSSRLTRPEFDRETFGARLTYKWNESDYKSHQVDLMDFSYNRIVEISSAFESNLNPIQKIAFNSAIISAMRYTYVLNRQIDKRVKHPIFFKGTIETSGNLLSLMDEGASWGSEDDRGVRSLYEVPYFQYVRVDVDYRFFWNITPKTMWVNRLYGATIRPYGNSVFETTEGVVHNPPFAKYLYMGGSSDLRAWPAYRLGAGSQANTNYYPINDDGTYDKTQAHDTSFAIGTIKLLFNSEVRFPLFSFFEGAVFVDAGNIWLNGGLEKTQPGTDFKLSDILNETAIGGGLGLRLDFDFFLIRCDIAAKIRDPGRLSVDDPWVIDNSPLRNLTYNIALGYPF